VINNLIIIITHQETHSWKNKSKQPHQNRCNDDWLWIGNKTYQNS